MLPVFGNIIDEIGLNNLTSQSSIEFVENNPFLNDQNQLQNWNWLDFYSYFSMQGLHTTQEFADQIASDPNKSALYDHYRDKSKDFSKNCTN